MKKALSIILLTAVTAAALSACGSGSVAPAETTQQPTQQVEKTAQQAAQPAESPGATADTFEQFRAALDDAGYTYEVTPMAAEMVGAERGEKYAFDFGSVELYRFADGAEALSTGEVTLEGFGSFPIKVSGNYGLIVSLDENTDEITAIFAGL